MANLYGIESAREGLAGKRRITSGMISLPQNDLRHIGHIGYDGAMYGDVAFIGSNYDKLPVKVQSPCKFNDGIFCENKFFIFKL